MAQRQGAAAQPTDLVSRVAVGWVCAHAYSVFSRVPHILPLLAVTVILVGLSCRIGSPRRLGTVAGAHPVEEPGDTFPPLDPLAQPGLGATLSGPVLPGLAPELGELGTWVDGRDLSRAEPVQAPPEDWDAQVQWELSPGVTLRPAGEPRFLPGSLGGRPDATPGPAFGASMLTSPNVYWKFGLDLVIRAEHMAPDNTMHDWNAYVIPGIEYVPNPQSASPVVIGLTAPISIGTRESSQGMFLFIRWEELFGQPKR